MDRSNKSPITREQVSIYETTKPLLEAMREELKELSKKKPDATLSKSKVTIINRLLADLTELLKEESNSKYLDMLNDDDLPQYSDVVLILSQFDAAMDSFKATHTEWDTGTQRWLLYDDDKSRVERHGRRV
ncbi:MAG TPA: hypothetical protein VG096_15205 [Bryobacteraceae bacterium]|jgi:hypothetical protein|nr:hypothetical protein [Bryobacteraceae bacterium]